MTLIVTYYDVGLGRNPSLSELGTGVFEVVQTGDDNARISVTSGTWAGFELEIVGRDFEFASGLPWSGSMASISILSPTGEVTLSISAVDALGLATDLGDDFGDFWATLQGSGALSAQEMLQNVWEPVEIHASGGNDSIRNWGYGVGSPSREIYLGAGADAIEDVVLNDSNLTSGSIFGGAGNDTFGGGVIGTAYGGEGDDYFISSNSEASYQQRFDYGGSGDDIFDQAYGFYIYAQGDEGYDRLNFRGNSSHITAFGAGVEEYNLLTPKTALFVWGPVASYVAGRPDQTIAFTATDGGYLSPYASGDYSGLQLIGFASATRSFTSRGSLITTNEDDVVSGGGHLQTLDGDDTVTATVGTNSLVDLGAGDDSVSLNYVSGGTVLGGLGDDTFRLIVNGAAAVYPFLLDGGEGTDRLFIESAGGLAVDLAAPDFSGHVQGIEFLQTGVGNDTLLGDEEGNILSAGLGRNYLDGRGGADSVDYSNEVGAVSVTLIGADLAAVTIDGQARDGIRNIENVIGGSGDDSVTGDHAANHFLGGLGDDVFFGGGGTDLFEVHVDLADADMEIGGEDEFLVIRSSEGSDRVYADVEFVQFNDRTVTFADLMVVADSLIEGGTGADALLGTPRANLMLGHGGDDWLTPRAGNDTVDGGDGVDMVSFFDAPLRAVINLAAGSALIGSDVNVLCNVENVTGSIFGDLITGDAVANRLRGLGDYDWFVGSGGGDSFEGGTGRDTVAYSSAAAGVVASLLTDTGTGGQANGDRYVDVENLTGSSLNDRLTGDDDRNVLRGLAGDDFIFGNGGNDTIDGGAGRDSLYGGLNTDRITGGRGNDVIDGGQGWDTALFTGTRSQYTVTDLGGGRTSVLHHAGGADGIDIVVNVEVLEFTDGRIFL